MSAPMYYAGAVVLAGVLPLLLWPSTNRTQAGEDALVKSLVSSLCI